MRNRLLRALWLLSPYRWLFVLAQIAMLLGAAGGLALPSAVSHALDILLQGGGLDALARSLAVLGGIMVMGEVGNYVKNYVLGYIGQRMVRNLRAQLYGKLLTLSLDYYDHAKSGDIASRMTNDITVFQQGLSSGLTYVVQQVLTLVAVVVLMFRLDSLLAAVVLASVVVVAAISSRMGTRVRQITRSTQKRLGDLMDIVNESVSGMSIIKSFSLEGTASHLFSRQNDTVLDRSMRAVKVQSRTRALTGLLGALSFLVTLGVGGYRVHLGVLLVADLIAFVLYAEMIWGPIGTLASLYAEVNRAVAAYDRICETLDAPRTINDPAQPVILDSVRGEVVFGDVSFSYEPGVPILDHVSLSVQPGETVALVGPSGAGKTTLVSLISRLYDVDEGTLTIDGVDVRDLALAALRGMVGIVPQDTHLFGFSILENILCGRPDASDEDVQKAAREANAHEFILGLSDGYATVAGERGARLSGGQRQRIAIARAFLKDPPILILDEATSSLDTHSERMVQKALETLMAGRTTLIIAHRLSTIVNADRIVVLDKGRVVAQGPHDELLETCALYADLYRKQFGEQQPALASVA